MPQKILITRTSTPNSPPADGSLDPGQLAVEMADPLRLWVGVPASLGVTGNKKQLTPSVPVTVSDTPPLTPKPGDLWFESDSGVFWLWYDDGTSAQWVQVNGSPGGGAGVTVADAPPASPSQGDLWWESDTAILWIWYDDGNTTQWVQAAGSSGGGSVDAYTKAESDAKYVELTGDTMTGPLSITQATAGALTLDGGDGVANITMAGGASGNKVRIADAYLTGLPKSEILQVNNLDTSGSLGLKGNIAGGNNNIFFFDYAGTTLHGVVFTAGRNMMMGVDGSSPSRISCDGASFVSFTDGCYKPAGGAWSAGSDERIKTVLGTYDSGLAQILAINPVRYFYKGNDTLVTPEHFDKTSSEPLAVPYENSYHYHVAVDQKEFVGLVAQDVEAVMPEMVSQKAGFVDGAPVSDLRMLDPSALTYALINAVKELSAEIEALKAQINPARR